MKISDPEVAVKNGEVVISARVTFDRPLLNKPERLWFSFPEKYADRVTQRSDAFAAGLIVLAMHSAEDMFVEGGLSPRLARGLAEYQRAFHLWFPQLPIIKIHARAREVESGQAGKETAMLFSGGIDSAFTLMRHLPDAQPLPEFQVKYALFIHGLDVPLQNRTSFENACVPFSRELAAAGVELIPVRTNLRYFYSGLMPWRIAHGCATIAAGLILDRLCGNLLVPATHYLDDLKPWGSSLMVDHWLSTESVEVIHDGISASRMDKVEAISSWQPAQRFLRVCTNEAGRDGVKNCSVCEKCLRTMVMLEMCGRLDQFQTFNRRIGLWDIVGWTPHYATNEVYVYTPTMSAFAKRTGKTQYLLPIAIAHLRGVIMFYVRKWTPKWLFHFLKKQKFPYERDPFNPARLEDAS